MEKLTARSTCVETFGGKSSRKSCARQATRSTRAHTLRLQRGQPQSTCRAAIRAGRVHVTAKGTSRACVPKGDPNDGDPKGGDPNDGDPKGGDPKAGEPKGGELKPK
eukprot:1982150-Pleurochrysis_carterae.AAC.1